MRIAPWHKRITRALPLCLGALLCCLAPAMALAASQWTTATVDNTAVATGKFASMKLDTNNKLHISYFDSAANLKYATNMNGSWTGGVSTVITGSVVSAGTAIAVDSSNNPRINYYYNNGGKGIRNVSYNGSWQTPVDIYGIGFTPTVNAATAIFNNSGYSYATFFKNGLYFATNNTGTWTSATVDTANGSMGTFNTLAVDSSGVAHVVYYNAATSGANNRKLRYKTRNATTGVWSSSSLVVTGATAGNNVGQYCGMTIDGANTLHVTYLDATTRNIMYTYKPSGDIWQIPVLIGASGSGTNTGGYNSLAVDSIGAVHVSYYYATGATTGTLRYATNLGGSWHFEDVDDSSTPNVGQYTSIAVDSNQTVYIAYYDVTNTALKVATKQALLISPASWDFGPVPVDPGSSSTAQTFTVTNNLMVGLTMGATTMTGSNLTQFPFSDGCNNGSIAPQATCTILASFAPASGLPLGRSATLTASSASPVVATVPAALSGTATDKLIIHASVGSGGGGSISPSGTFTVARNGSQTFTVTPDSGYTIDSVTDNGSPLSAPYTISGIAADHTVVASFTPIVSMPFMIMNSLTSYGTLQAAYDAANDNNTILSWSGTFATDNLTVGQNLTTTLKGGYDITFSNQTGTTILQGILVHVPNDNPGSLIVENVVLK